MGKGKKQRGKPSKRENENGDIRSAKRWTTATNPVQAICDYCKKSFDTLEEWRKHTYFYDLWRRSPLVLLDCLVGYRAIQVSKCNHFLGDSWHVDTAVLDST